MSPRRGWTLVDAEAWHGLELTNAETWSASDLESFLLTSTGGRAIIRAIASRTAMDSDRATANAEELIDVMGGCSFGIPVHRPYIVPASVIYGPDRTTA